MVKNFFKDSERLFKSLFSREIPFLKEASFGAEWLTECLVFENYHTGTDLQNMASMTRLLSQKQNRDNVDKAMGDSVRNCLFKHFLEDLVKKGYTQVSVTKTSASEIFSHLREETGLPFNFPDSHTKMNLHISKNSVVAKWGKEKEEVLLRGTN